MLKGHTGSAFALVVLQNGDLVSGSWDETIRVWSSGTYEYKRVLKGYNSSVWSLGVLPNGDLASGSYDNKIRVWNVDTGEYKQEADGVY